MQRPDKRLAWAFKAREPALVASYWRWRRAVFVQRVQAAARWVRAELDLDVADDVVIHPGVRVTLQPQTANRLHIGRGTRLGPRVLMQLKGGTIDLGAGVDLRRDTILNVAGHLRLTGDNILGWGCVVHCDRQVVLGEMSSASEYVTIADSSHYTADPDEHFYHSVRRGSVVVGRNTWLASKATLARNTVVGDHCIVAANSVVIGEVPDRHLASGVPATTRPLRLDWAGDAATPDAGHAGGREAS